MTDKTLAQFAAEITKLTKSLNENYHTFDALSQFDDNQVAFLGAREILISAQSKYIEALEQRLIALEPQPLATSVAIVWLPSAPVCSCATFGGDSDDWNCKVCGGGRF